MKKNKGVTMVALIITIVLMLIIAGISLNAGNDVIKRSKLENLETNMLLIKSKGKEYVENANFKLGTDSLDYDNRIETAKQELKGTETTDISEDSLLTKVGVTSIGSYTYYYTLSTQDLINMGITNVSSSTTGECYIIKYDVVNAQVEVYNTKGYEYEAEDGTKKTEYSLTDVQSIEL